MLDSYLKQLLAKNYNQEYLSQLCSFSVMQEFVDK